MNLLKLVDRRHCTRACYIVNAVGPTTTVASIENIYLIDFGLVSVKHFEQSIFVQEILHITRLFEFEEIVNYVLMLCKLIYHLEAPDDVAIQVFHEKYCNYLKLSLGLGSSLGLGHISPEDISHL